MVNAVTSAPSLDIKVTELYLNLFVTKLMLIFHFLPIILPIKTSTTSILAKYLLPVTAWKKADQNKQSGNKNKRCYSKTLYISNWTSAK